MTIDISINEKTFATLKSEKEKNDFGQRSWDDWFNHVFPNSSDSTFTDEIIKQIQEKNVLDHYFDSWIKNFALNLENIWNDNSVSSLKPENLSDNSFSSAIVIGRGPSLKKNSHLQILSESDYKGTILCTDGALKTVLDEGVTPEKFKNFFVISIDSQDKIKKYYDDPLIKKYGNRIKCILSTTISPITYQYAKNSGMEIFWVHTLFDYDKGKTSFNHIAGLMAKSKNEEKKIPAIQTGGNVGTSSWIIGWSILKSTHIGLIGIDHGFTPDTTWDEIGEFHPSAKPALEYKKDSEIFQKAFPKIYNPDFDCYCIQDPIFQYYSNALKEFIPKTSKFVKTINATEGGAIFGEGITCTSFKSFLRDYNY